MRNRIDFLRTRVIVNAIVEAAKVIREGGGFNGTNDALKAYKNALFPEIGQELARTAAETEKLLEKEFERGPMQVEALDYSLRKGRKKRR